MSKLCNGQDNNQSVNVSNAKSFCEGMQYRSEGTSAAKPVTSNPHVPSSEDYDSWLRGWTLADVSQGGVIPPSLAGCCAVPQNTILA